MQDIASMPSATPSIPKRAQRPIQRHHISSHDTTRVDESTTKRISKFRPKNNILRKVSAALLSHSDVNFDSLSDREMKRLKEENLSKLGDLVKAYGVEVNDEDYDKDNIEELMGFVARKTREAEIMQIANRKERRFFGGLGLVCACATMLNFNATRIYESQSENRSAYSKLFYKMAIEEYEAEGEEDPFQELIKSVGITLLISAAAIFIEKKVSSDVASMFQKMASDLASPSHGDDNVSGGGNGGLMSDIMSMFMK